MKLSHNIDQNDINGAWNHIRDGITKVSEQILGFRPPHKEEWITEDTWKMIELRKTVKNAVDDIGRNLYQSLSKACTVALRRDYRKQIEDLARDADSAANLRDMKQLYSITRKLANTNSSKVVPVRDKVGTLLTTTEDQLKRWHQHFEETLNFDDVTTTLAENDNINVRETGPSRSVNSNPPTITEIRNAIKDMKSGKAAGIDQITPEVLKADVNLFADLLLPIFKMVWEQEKLPDDWLQGVLVKIPKKGDLSNCNNYRGISLLSLPSKVLFLQR